MVRVCIPNDGRVVSNFIVQALQNKDTYVVWRRTANTQLPVCGRPGGRHDTPDEFGDGFTGPCKYWQPGEFTIMGWPKKRDRTYRFRSKLWNCRNHPMTRWCASPTSRWLKRTGMGTAIHLEEGIAEDNWIISKLVPAAKTCKAFAAAFFSHALKMTNAANPHLQNNSNNSICIQQK